MTSEPIEGMSEVEVEIRGTFAPESWDEVKARYQECGPTAQTVVREIARTMSFDREEYAERVTGDVVETARQAIFAEMLSIRIADQATFESWRTTYSGNVRVAGSDNVERVAWHVSPVDEAVAATFANEPEAAVGTVRRMAFNRIYRDELVEGDGDE